MQSACTCMHLKAMQPDKAEQLLLDTGIQGMQPFLALGKTVHCIHCSCMYYMPKISLQHPTALVLSRQLIQLTQGELARLAIWHGV